MASGVVDASLAGDASDVEGAEEVQADIVRPMRAAGMHLRSISHDYRTSRTRSKRCVRRCDGANAECEARNVHRRSLAPPGHLAKPQAEHARRRGRTTSDRCRGKNHEKTTGAQRPFSSDLVLEEARFRGSQRDASGALPSRAE